MVIPGANYPDGCNKGAQMSGVPQGDVCSGSQPNSLGRGAKLVGIYLVQLYQQPKNISFPLLANVAV